METLQVLIVLSVFALLALPLVIAIRRSTELFVLRVKDGELEHLRGRLPPRLLEDIRDVLTRPAVRAAMVKVITEGGEPRVIATGDLSDVQTQQLRNVVGSYRTAQIRSGRRPG